MVLTVAADCYAYVAIAGLAFAGAFYAMRLPEMRSKVIPVLLPVLLATCLLYPGIYSNRRICGWYDTDTLKNDGKPSFVERSICEFVIGNAQSLTSTQGYSSH
jgi:hypothetical protein